MSDAFFALDTQWRFTYVNYKAAQFLHRSPEELYGKNFWEEFPELVNSDVYEEYHGAVAKQVGVAFEQYYRRLKVWVEVRAFPSHDGISVFFLSTGGNSRQFEKATILFADLVNFTQISTTMSATKLVYLLNEIFSVFDQLSRSTSLEKIKTIGDAYMVAAGIPIERPDRQRRSPKWRWIC